MKMIDWYNDTVDDDDVYLASSNNAEVVWLQVIPVISDIVWFTLIHVQSR